MQSVLERSAQCAVDEDVLEEYDGDDEAAVLVSCRSVQRKSIISTKANASREHPSHNN